MQRAAAKIFPKLLNFKQKPHCMDTAQEMLSTFKDDPDLLKTVITRDESWVYGYDIFTDVLGMKRVAVKIVPKLLNAQEMLTTFNDDLDLLKKVITGNESWVYGDVIETKAKSCHWKGFCSNELLTIPKSTFQKCFKDWKKRWHK